MNLQYWVFAAFCLPIIGFALFAFVRTPAPPESEERFVDDFLVTSRSSTSSDVGASTVAYMLQISTTFYFVFWGYRYGLSNIAYIITWAFGIWIFSRFARRLLVVRDDFETLAHFLASPSGRALRVAIGLLIGLFFLGLVYVETFFAADFLSALFSTADQGLRNTLWWLFFLILLVAVASYSYIGGMRKVIETDRIQLSIAYLGFAVVFAHLIPLAVEKNLPTGLLVWFITISIYTIIHFRLSSERVGSLVKWSVRISMLILLLSLVIAKPWDSTQSLIQPLLIAGPLKQVTEPWGWVTLLGFTVIYFGNSATLRTISVLLAWTST